MTTKSTFIRILNSLSPLQIAVLGIVIIVLIIAYIPPLFSGKKKKKLQELKKASKEKAHGIIFGKKGKKLIYSPTDAEGSVGVFSASGTGKTSSIGIPTLRSWTGTSFTIDISGDICKNCPDMKNKLVYEPENPKTTPYNLFGAIDILDSTDDKNEALQQLAFLLIPDQKDVNVNAKFFIDSGRKILTAALLAFYHEKLDFIDICVKITNSSYQQLFEEIDKTNNNDAINFINGFADTRIETIAECKQSCDDAITLFATNAKVRNSIRRPRGNETAIEGKLIEDYNIFIIVEDPKLTLYAPLLNIITSQQMQYISNRRISKNSKQILLFLDEYASLNLDATAILEATRKYRKRHCRLMIMTQNLADLEILYGHDITRAIVSNLKFKVLLGGLAETESQKYFAELIGYQNSKKTSTTTSSSGQSQTETETKEYKIEPADLDNQGKDTVILICASEEKGYMKLKKNYYFKK